MADIHEAQVVSAARNLRLIAVELGDLLKYHVPLNHIDRVALAVFTFPRQPWASDAITSLRARRIFDWIASLEESEAPTTERDSRLITFATALARDGPTRSRVLELLVGHGLAVAGTCEDLERKFDALGLHPRLVSHCRKLFGQGHFFHAVFEAAKIFEREVQVASGIARDGEALMMTAWDAEHGTLPVTGSKTRSEINVQDGLKFLSAGLVRAFRNPTAHEPALLWPVWERDAIDILGLVSFLLRQLDRAVSRRSWSVTEPCDG
jgi:uncharacterized protein (TIGR02391 family)